MKVLYKENENLDKVAWTRHWEQALREQAVGLIGNTGRAGTGTFKAVAREQNHLQWQV